MSLPSVDLRRRMWLRASAAVPAAAALPLLAPSPALAQPDTGRALRLVQLLDTSATQQELSRDYATGVRLAWAGESTKGRPLARVGLQTVNTEGTPAAVRAALDNLVQDASVIGLVGTVGDGLAVQVQAALRERGLKLPHIAPWMADSRHEQDDGVACLFASRTLQLQQALSAMQGLGVNELCVVYNSKAEQALYDPQVSEMAKTLSLRVARLAGDSAGGMATLAPRIPASCPMVLCLATSAELAQLTQAMSARKDRRFVLGLGDVDAPSLMQLSPGRGVPVILTQVVPNPVRSNLPLVQTYRSRLSQLFDEPPSPISLAGYIAGRYTAALVRDSSGSLSRESLMAQLVKRAPQDLDGWRVDFREAHRGSRFVTHTLLGADGKLIG